MESQGGGKEVKILPFEFSGSIRISQIKYSTKNWRLSPCSFVTVGVGLTQAKPWTDGDGDEAEGASPYSF